MDVMVRAILISSLRLAGEYSYSLKRLESLRLLMEIVDRNDRGGD